MVPVLFVLSKTCLVFTFRISSGSFCRPPRTMMKVMMLTLVVIQTMSHPAMVQIKRKKPWMRAFQASITSR